ncbi:hypothetical protein FJ419_17490 [Mesorhizobium sp. B2-6-2]|nr:hypothetical protein FJ419_17490 [Mesorhizobium sp. B2-6-2]
MATYTKLSFGSWRVQVRRKGRYASETFLRRDDARLPNVFRIRSKERLTNDVHSSRCAAPAD